MIENLLIGKDMANIIKIIKNVSEVFKIVKFWFVFKVNSRWKWVYWNNEKHKNALNNRKRTRGLNWIVLIRDFRIK